MYSKLLLYMTKMIRVLNISSKKLNNNNDNIQISLICKTTQDELSSCKQQLSELAKNTMPLMNNSFALKSNTG